MLHFIFFNLSFMRLQLGQYQGKLNFYDSLSSYHRSGELLMVKRAVIVFQFYCLYLFQLTLKCITMNLSSESSLNQSLTWTVCRRFGEIENYFDTVKFSSKIYDSEFIPPMLGLFHRYLTFNLTEESCKIKFIPLPQKDSRSTPYKSIFLAWKLTSNFLAWLENCSLN